MRTFTFVATLLFSFFMSTQAGSIHSVEVVDIDGHATTLAAYQGKVMLIVNVASKCGNTPQYAGLETIFQTYKDQGLVILGFPCNQFGGQEPGTNDEIKAFCSMNYGVTFPLFDKIEVNGPGRHPLYNFLAGETSPFSGDITWNFGKFLIGRDGTILQRFEPKTQPKSTEVVSAIQSALAVR